MAHTTLHSISKIALDHAQSQGAWVVLVCPDADSLAQYRGALIGVIPAGASFSGRTVLLKNGGKLTVTGAEVPVFIPEGVPFTAMFAGWAGADKKSISRGMAGWRERATSVLDSRTLLERT